MNKLFKNAVLLSVVMLMVVSTTAFAAKVQVIHGTFINEKGDSVDFTAVDGQTLLVKNSELGLTYTLTARVIEKDRVALTLEQYSNHELESLVASDVMELDLDGERHSSPLAPFSLALTGITLEDRSSRSSAEAPGEGGHCCITCGGWQVCCYPSEGWCCTLSSSCGNSCGVCNQS